MLFNDESVYSCAAALAIVAVETRRTAVQHNWSSDSEHAFLPEAGELVMKQTRSRWTLWCAVLLLAGTRLPAQDLQPPTPALALTKNYDEVDQPGPPPQLEVATGGNACGCNTCGCNPCGGCGNCDQCCNNGCERPWFPAVADHCPRYGIYSFGGFESWRGVADDNGPNNNGFLTGLNVGVPIRGLDKYGIGLQGGFSSGFYDLMGRSTNGNDEANQTQQQHYVTYGLFRRADCDRPFSFGVVHDWSINNNFGTLSQEPTLSQFRAQVAYATSAKNEFGIWAAWHDRAYTADIAGARQLNYRSVNQTNFFWHRKWCYGGADSWMWLGFPNRSRIDGNLGGTLGEIIAGGMMNVPVNDRISMYTNLQYMKPSARGGVPGAREDFFSLGVGLAFYPGCTARTRTVAGRSWMPMMPVANNGTFMVDRGL
jgi:hypothetical protein